MPTFERVAVALDAVGADESEDPEWRWACFVLAEFAAAAATATLGGDLDRRRRLFDRLAGRLRLGV